MYPCHQHLIDGLLSTIQIDNFRSGRSRISQTGGQAQTGGRRQPLISVAHLRRAQGTNSFNSMEFWENLAKSYVDALRMKMKKEGRVSLRKRNLPLFWVPLWERRLEASHSKRMNLFWEKNISCWKVDIIKNCDRFFKLVRPNSLLQSLCDGSAWFQTLQLLWYHLK